ncbi:hypothetical protein CMI47_10095 [Candidatus Pacearchaeota archaeon]|nr:hypothetical protein [Candidatus Pacearchaeota archaeon]|tara:strand:- start:1221 stop:1526 length:306 start_codon:yes stop_codon:yes gene_type:complete
MPTCNQKLLDNLENVVLNVWDEVETNDEAIEATESAGLNHTQAVAFNDAWNQLKVNDPKLYKSCVLPNPLILDEIEGGPLRRWIYETVMSKILGKGEALIV